MRKFLKCFLFIILYKKSDPIMASPGVYDLNKLKSPLPEAVPHKRQCFWLFNLPNLPPMNMVWTNLDLPYMRLRPHSQVTTILAFWLPRRIFVKELFYIFVCKSSPPPHCGATLPRRSWFEKTWICTTWGCFI